MNDVTRACTDVVAWSCRPWWSPVGLLLVGWPLFGLLPGHGVWEICRELRQDTLERILDGALDTPPSLG
jgi:hypothetical protein